MSNEIEEMLMLNDWEKMALRDCGNDDIVALYNNDSRALTIQRVGVKLWGAIIVGGNEMDYDTTVFRAPKRKPREGDVVRGKAYNSDKYENFLVNEYGDYCSLTEEIEAKDVDDVKLVLTADGTVVK